MTTAPPRPHFAALSTLILLCVIPAPALAEEGLGRLFFTPERRQAMDRQRQLNPLGTTESASSETPTLTINGIVTRSSGKRTVWINGEAQHENDSLGTVRARPDARHPGQVSIHPDDAPPARAAVGDTVLRDTGETAPLLGDGQIRINRAPTGVR